MALKTKLKAIADAIRAKGGTTDNLSLDGMVTAIKAIPSGGEDTAVALIERTIAKANYPTITSVGSYAFAYCFYLTAINLPICTKVGQGAFQYCSNISSINLPICETIEDNGFQGVGGSTIYLSACTSVGSYGFQGMSNLVKATLPSCTDLKFMVFDTCQKLTTVDLTNCTRISSYAFQYCFSFKTLILRNTQQLVTLTETNAFDGCCHFNGIVDSVYNPEGLKDGYIYVPDTLVDSYKEKTNWSTYADQIKPLSELPTEA